MNRILKANAAQPGLAHPGTLGLPDWLPKIKPKNSSDQSGRRDLNPRPLDPSHERPVWPGRRESAREPFTCYNVNGQVVVALAHFP
jgi:hypothetical protein